MRKVYRASVKFSRQCVCLLAHITVALRLRFTSGILYSQQPRLFIQGFGLQIAQHNRQRLYLAQEHSRHELSARLHKLRDTKTLLNAAPHGS